MFETQLLKLFREEAQKENITLTDIQFEQFFQYMKLLQEWNHKMNLTAIVDDEEIVVKHFLDSLSICKYIEKKNANFIDIGTGAGFPGIPIKIIFENLEVMLLDSLQKRISFLNQVIQETNIHKIKAVHGRAEDMGHHKDYREKYDYVTARAVAKLPVLLEYCLPFVKVGGHFIAMKAKCEDEIVESKKALELLGGEIIHVESKVLPHENAERTIIYIRKFRHVSTGFPRKAGKPSKEPIK